MEMKNLMRHLMLVLMLVMAGAVMAGESEGDIPFNGLILDGNNQPVKKVKVYNTDKDRYAMSDKKGRFGLTNVGAEDTLTLIVKKNKIRIPVEGRKSMKIILEEGPKYNVWQDEDLVNEGYGYVKRREYTGSSAGISGDQLRRSGQRNVLQALTGLVPGLTVTTTDGQTRANIRGQRSLLLSNEPLYMVDGTQVESLDFVSVYDVEHVEVLKSAPQYGMRGANGAILVTTRGAARKK